MFQTYQDAPNIIFRLVLSRPSREAFFFLEDLCLLSSVAKTLNPEMQANWGNTGQEG